jgi:hypothetical protein
MTDVPFLAVGVTAAARRSAMMCFAPLFRT